MTKKNYLTINDLAIEIGVSVATLEKWLLEFEDYIFPVKSSGQLRLFGLSMVERGKLLKDWIDNKKRNISTVKQLLKKISQKGC